MNEKEQEFSALKLSLEFGYTIVIPLVALALLGRLLDKQFDTSPWLLIIGVILSMIVSSVALVMKFKKIITQIDTTSESQKKESDEKKN